MNDKINYKLAMEILGTTNIFKTLIIFIKWILTPEIAIKTTSSIVSNFGNNKNMIFAEVIAVGYINEFFSKYIEFGKKHKDLILINEKIDKKIVTKDKIANALITLRKLRSEIKEKFKKVTLNEKQEDQIITTAKSFGISKGIVKGVVLNVNNTDQIIPKNCIGIFPTAGVKFTTQFLKCVGIIFLNGAITSHGAILAREFDIPALVSPNVKIPNGQTITIDGSSGKIINSLN